MRLYFWESNRVTLIVVAPDLRSARRQIRRESDAAIVSVSLDPPFRSWTLKDNPKNRPSVVSFQR